jgi:DNA-binding PadR family transcriptional regulator
MLNRCDYTILGIMRAKNASDEIHGITPAEISTFEQTSKPSTIRKRIYELKRLGFVGDGVKSGREKTYYITEKGLECLKGGMSVG